jgi:hypothetical protein
MVTTLLGIELLPKVVPYLIILPVTKSVGVETLN